MTGHHEPSRDGFLISTDPGRLDLDVIHGFLRSSYWAAGIPREVVERSIRGSLCFGLYQDGEGQIGFARVITDRATFAHLADVFVLEPWRGRGLSKWLRSPTNVSRGRSRTAIRARPEVAAARLRCRPR